MGLEDPGAAMSIWKSGMRVAAALAVAVAFGVMPGCAYFRHRAEDAAEVIDLGVTWSDRFGLAAYGNFASITPGGLGYVDGYFAGIGGGQIGATEHYEGSIGLLGWGYEEVGWGDHDKNVPGTLDRQHVGLLGFLLAPFDRRLSYAPS